MKRLLLFILILSLLTACSHEPVISDEIHVSETPHAIVLQPSKTGDNIFSLNFFPEYGLNPFTCTSSSNLLAAGLVYECVLNVNPDFSYSSGLCILENCENDKVFTLHLKSGISFHDGSPLCAEDILYSLETARSSQRYASRFTFVEDMSCDGNSVIISLSRPNASFPSLLDIPVIRSGSADESFPCGTGPYSYVDNNSYICLRAFENYRENLPADRIYLQNYSNEALPAAFEGGYIDLVSYDPLSSSSLYYNGDFENYSYAAGIMHYLGFNFRNSIVSQSTFRQAICSCIDRSSLAPVSDSILPAVLPLPPSSSRYDDSFETDLSESRSKVLLSSLGIGDLDDDGYMDCYIDGILTSLSLKMIVNRENSVKLDCARKVCSSIEKLGVKVELEELAWDDFIHALNRGNFDLYYAQIQLSSDFDLYPLFNGALNYGHSDFPYESYSENYLAGNTSDFFEAFSENMPICPLFFEKHSILIRRGSVSGLSPTSANAFHGLKNWKINFN